MLPPLLTATTRLRLLAFLLVFIFGGAIVGETVALSIVVSVAGTGALSRLFLVNGLLLLGLPLLFFNNIDRFRRERMLSLQLWVTAVLLVLYLIIYYTVGTSASNVATFLLLVIYPLAYLSKTVLFLTFWTLANDVCNTGEAKKEFPGVAAWGFVGGLAGAWTARALLEVVSVERIILLWAGLYGVALLFMGKVGHAYGHRLLRVETATSPREQLPELVNDVLEIKLVRVMAVLYFLLFVSIFSLDYLFWQQCHRWFPTSRGLASFQFSFYVVHGIVTVIGLRLVTPVLISRWGFTRILFSLPAVLLTGSALVMGFHYSGLDAKTVFAGFILLQFLRYVVFENAFSPIYQMFFVAIPKERRGRAKTFLEGVIKPGALFLTGLYLTLLEGHQGLVLMIIIAASGGMTYLAFVIRRTYVGELFPRSVSQPLQVDAVREIGSQNDLKILSLIQEYASSSDTDLRGLAVRMLSHNGSRQALGILREIYDNEDERSIREMIAGSLGNFYWFETKKFVEELLRHDNPRVRANALSSLTELNCRWKWELRGSIESMLFENNLRVQIEAARFLWSSGDRYERETIRAFLGSLLGSKNASKRSAGLYLVGLLQPAKWEEVLLTNLRSTSLQVFTKSIEVILRHASHQTKVAALKSVEDLSRERITIAGRTAQTVGESAVRPLVEYVTRAQSRRMVFEVVRALRVTKHRTGNSDPGFERGTDTEKVILRWAYRELVRGYRDAYMWQRCRTMQGRDTELSGFVILDDALRTRVLRVAEWALDAMILLDREGVITWSRKALDLWEDSHRLDMVEILETLSDSRLGALIIPIFKFDSWDDIARTGKGVFKFADRSGEGLEYFARSENRWIRVCAFYCLFQSRRLERLLAGEPHLLENLGADSYPYIAKAARSLLAQKNSTGRIEVETFSLLETVLFLKKTPLFRNIAGEKLMGLAEICDLRAYEKGTVISREGDVSDHLIIVRSGSLDIVKGKGDLRTVLSVIRAGETYGEIGLFTQSQRSASAIAHEDCELYIVQRSSLKRLLLNMPDIAYNFLEIFSDRLRNTGEEVAALRAELSNPNRAAALPSKIRTL